LIVILTRTSTEMPIWPLPLRLGGGAALKDRARSYTRQDNLEEFEVKLFLTAFLYLVGTVLVLELLGLFAGKIARDVGVLNETAIAAVCVAFAVHGALALYRLSCMPAPLECTWADIAAGLCVGCAALLFLPVGLPFYLIDMPVSAAACVQWVAFCYGLLLGGTATLLFLALAVMKVSDAVVDPLCDAFDELHYLFRKKLGVMRY
jgi:hypothetical protein